LVRTFVVASATLAILLVVFSMYQYSQLGPDSSAVRAPRLPPPPSEPSVADRITTPMGGPGVPLGQGVIGPGQNITVSIYPREGTRARLELAVSDWIPKDGSDHEFILTGPQVRMRTKDGNDVRVTAREGVLDAQRKAGGGLDPKRGQLTGDVVIEYDRRSDKDKASLPEALRNQVDPSELVRVEMERLEFDLEYAKLVVPGPIHVAARDVELHGEDLEIRFNEAQGRVESLRIARGGRLDLLERGAQLGVNVPGIDRRGERRTTLADWLRTTIQSRLDRQTQSAPAAPAPTSAASASGVPVFRADTEKEDTPGPPVRYFARFEGDVDAKQFAGDATRSRLQADVLEILREFSDADKDRVRSPAAPTQGTPGEPPVTPTGDRIVLEWTGKLVVDALSRGDERWTEDVRSQVTALGTPARLSHPEGDATCSKLIYEPDGSEVQLFGSEAVPVVVRSSDQGAMTGQFASLRRGGDALDIRVTGPGRLTGALNPNATAAAVPSPPSMPKTESFIEFGKELTAQGRFVTKTTVDFTGSVSTRERRVLDRASFSGRVVMEEGETRIEADSIDLGFAAQPGGRGDRQAVERMIGRGDVVMIQGADRITCREIDVALATDADGRSQPRAATATGDVAAVQGERTLHARDKLVVDFDRVEDEPKRNEEARSRTGVKRLQAFGAVTVFDPAQKLDLSAGQLDCSVVKGREIEKALVTGTADRPATVRLDTLTVTGRQITLDVPDQWAEVPGEGRLTFLSRKDLDGRKVSNPIPIVVTWADSMKYRGRENRAVFNGRVHATSETTTTFDCDQLLVEFDESPQPVAEAKRVNEWGILQPFVNAAMRTEKPRDVRFAGGAYAKEPAYILADGHAVAEMSETDPKSGELSSRSRIAGPRLSVNLRSEVSKMLIEGPGTLQLEDFRPDSPSRDSTPRTGSGLFALDKDSGPSKTLIEWRERMWYDFSIAQTRFEGRVQLKHFSGAALARLFEGSGGGANQSPGRSTFLTSDVLTVDFLDRDSRAKPALSREGDASGKRMGRLSSDRLRQFQASGSVVLQDQVEGLSVTADSVVYERPRQILAISGSRQRKAQIITQKPGRLPNQVATERLFYNLATGKLELVQTTVKGQ
jgi:lipopolysaccharide export system protein LptA